MNWLKNFVRPRFPSVFRDHDDTPDNLWQSCKQCGEMIFHRDLALLQKVCPGCDHHMRVGARERFTQIFDDGVFEKVDVPDVPHDPLKFKDQKRYADRLRDARNKTGDRDAVQVALGTIQGRKSVIAVQDFQFMGGSLGMAAGEAVVTAGQTALENNAPLIMVAAAGGARMQEGILSLMQLAKTSAALARLSETGLPFFSILTNPTMAGVMASYASLGDVIIAEPEALIGFAGPRVIKETTQQDLPEGFQTSEFLLEHGLVDMIIPRSEMRERMIHLIKALYGAKQPA